MNKISVIVPCYNVEKYLANCLDSLIAAKVPSMEIILVNDGSTDNTLNIIKKYKKEHSDLFKIIDKKNGGLSSARNAGIEASTGTYLSFVDSDDSVLPDLYSKLNDIIEGDSPDVIVFGENRIFSDHTEKVSSGLVKSCQNKEEIKKIMPYIYPAACNKLYKRDLFKNIKFTEGIWYEDVEFIYRLLPYLNTITVLEGYYYNYYQREGSITYTYNSKLYDLVDNLNSLVSYYQKNNLFKEYHEELEYTYVRYSYATFIKRLAKMKNKKEFNRGVGIVIKNVQNNFPDYKKNKYLVGKKGLYLKYFNRFIANIIYLLEKNKAN